MWSDMQKELGDNPNEWDRVTFKQTWCSTHFPGEKITSSCFLCEYMIQNDCDCDNCLIDWTGRSRNSCLSYNDYRYAPISTILALPERKIKNEKEKERERELL